MYLLVTSRKGVSSLQMSKEIGVTQKTAWFMLQRLREACGSQLGKLRGDVEIDECFVGGREINKHRSARMHAGRGGVGKVAVLGMRERGGRTVAKPIKDRSMQTIQSEIHANVEIGSRILTDEHAAYTDMGDLFFRHEAVNHAAQRYVKGDASTNGIESVWAVLKRGLIGVYHHVSAKHLGRYVNEFAFRLNAGNVTRHTLDRLDSFVDSVVGKRVTYAELTA
jgi:transposase-like protein